MREFTKEERLQHFNKEYEYIKKQSQDYLDYSKVALEKLELLDGPLPSVKEVIEDAKKDIMELPMSNCQETFMGVDISQYLEMIRHSKIENALTIFIKDGKVVKYIIEEGMTFQCSFNFGREIKIARELKIDGLFHVHNHPSILPAGPHTGDIICDTNMYLGQPFKFEFGVVTDYDFWSSEQNDSFIQKLIARNRWFEINRMERNKTRDYEDKTLQQHIDKYIMSEDIEIEVVPRYI